MKTLKHAILLLLALLVASPAYAGLESCRDPTPEEQFQLDLCSAHAGCRLTTSLISGCASLTNTIKRFFAAEKPPLDPGEYKSDKNATPGPSELEQARKDNERWARDKNLKESQARDAYNELVVLDRSIKRRLDADCGNPLSYGCKAAVSDAESLANKINAFNSNPDFVEVRGKLTAASPSIAAPYSKLQADAWEETKRKSDELDKLQRENQELKQKTSGANNKQKGSSQEALLQPDTTSADTQPADNADSTITTALPRRNSSSGTEMFQQAITQVERAEQEEKERSARAAKERARLAVEAEASVRQQQAQAAADRSRESHGGSGRSSSATPRANAGGRSCKDILNSLIGPINDGNPLNAAGSNLRYSDGERYSDQVWAMQVYIRVANTHPACANDPSTEKIRTQLRSVQEYCRERMNHSQRMNHSDAGLFNCTSGQSFGGTAAKTEAAIRQLFQEAPASGGTAANARPVSGDCKAAYDRQEVEDASIAQRIANTGSVIQQSQLLLGMLGRRMSFLDRLCKGQPQYAEYASLKQQYDSTLRACRGVASDPGDCVAK